MLASVRPVLRAFAVTVAPDAGALTPEGWAALETIMQRALMERPRKVQRQFVLLLHVIELLPLLRFGRRFSRLDATTRTRVVTSLQRAPVLLLRRGVWGARTLVFMGYYAQPAVAAALGYRASPMGWSARELPRSRAIEVRTP